MMLYRALLLALATAHAWNECAFPDVGYYAVDEGLGLSFAYGAAAMNGNLYTGGYYKGHYALVGVTDSGEVAPEPSATLWGDVTSDVQVRMAQTSEPSRPPLDPVPLLSALASQSTEPLRCGDERRREDDEKLVHDRHGHPKWLTWPWCYCQPSPS